MEVPLSSSIQSENNRGFYKVRGTLSGSHLCAESLRGSVSDVGVHVLGVDGLRGHELAQQSDYLAHTHAKRGIQNLSRTLHLRKILEATPNNIQHSRRRNRSTTVPTTEHQR